ncbi:hypothetical protein [Alkalihalobacillus deserti]|uniref:hypothetical protein n=1 Tax=Alkalihalobacillus deserti TaxID=2879466 RepID=UPI001D1579C3|nr:hypothetical protein [Alkalihalobacillus deserti]
MKKLIILIGSIVFLGVVGCSSGNDKLDTSILKTMGENPDGGASYVFPSYEILLDAVPFKAQLPVHIPIAGGTAHLWEPHAIIANSDLTEVSVSFSKKFLQDGIEEGTGALYLKIANYKDKSWDNHENKKKIKLDEKTDGYFYYLESDSNYVDLRFSKEGIYYIVLYNTVEKSLEERKEELIKIANSMVEYDEWYDVRFEGALKE